MWKEKSIWKQPFDAVVFVVGKKKKKKGCVLWIKFGMYGHLFNYLL